MEVSAAAPWPVLNTESGIHPAQGLCFHCGQPLREGDAGRYTVRVAGETRDTCCTGCQAVAELIAGQGLQSYYRNRTQYAPPPSPAGGGQRFELFDWPEVTLGYVRQNEEGLNEAALLLEGVTCAACLWLIEERVRAIDGVRAASVNHGVRRLRVTWDGCVVKLSAILGAIAALGYGAELYDAARSEAALKRERRALL